MRAAMVRAYGPPESITVEDLPDLEPGPGEVVVDVQAASINYPDVLIAANQYQVSVPPPFTPGSEFAGTVRSVGDGVTSVAPGDRVVGSTFVGAFAEQVKVPAASLHPIGPDLDVVSASAYRVTYGTAYHSLRSVAEVQPGEWVTVLGAAGGVGSASIDIAHVLGAKVLAAASSPEKLAACQARGAEALVDYEHDDLKARIKELTGGGTDVVIDPVGGRYAEEALRSTRWGGRFVTVGFASGEIPRIPLNLVLLKGVIIKGFEMRTFGQHAPELQRRDEAELLALVEQGRIRPLVSSVHPLSRVSDALLEVAERRAVGKVVIDTTS